MYNPSYIKQTNKQNRQNELEELHSLNYVPKYASGRKAHEETGGGDAVAAKGVVSFNACKRAVRKCPCTLLTCVRQ